MKVSEMFKSIQGESTRAGELCFFIRLSGCNLRCSYCDTTYAYEGGDEYSIDALLKEAKSAGIKLVEVTGGEPLLNKDTPLLIKALLDEGFEVMVETNGTLSISEIDPRTKVIMDVKSPSSGAGVETHIENLELLKSEDEVKFVLASRADYEWAKGFILAHSIVSRATVLLAPVFGELEPRELIKWMLADGLEARLNLQMHKYIFGPEAKGV